MRSCVIGAGLLRPRKTGHPANWVVSVPLPHTAVISQPRGLEVHIEFNGLDHVLGALPLCCVIEATCIPQQSKARHVCAYLAFD